MAETQETVSKSVQELANTNQVPEKYIYAQGSINTYPLLFDVPQVDLSLLTSPNRQQQLNKLQSGLKSCGCIQKKMTNSSQTNAGTVSAATTTVAHNRSNAALAPAEKPAKFSGVDFKRWQQKMFFYLTTLSLQKFINENVPVMSDETPADERFLVINHGMEDSFLDKVREISKKFFALPTEEKLKYARTVNQIEGYGNDKVLTDKQRLDWSDRLCLNVFPEDIRELRFWPQKPECFREVFEEYMKNMKLLSESLLKAMAASLNVEENCFLDQCGERGTTTARFNFYPPCPRPDVVLGVKQHADASAITILLQDKEVEGLQVLKDDQWFRVPVVPYGLLINVGDQVEVMSNGIFKSPVHRVVTNAERERNSLAVFIMPDVHVGIGPVEKLINEERPRGYKDIKNYVALFFQSYQQGKIPIEAAKISQEFH